MKYEIKSDEDVSSNGADENIVALMEPTGISNSNSYEKMSLRVLHLL